MHRLEATVLLSIYLRSELTPIDTRVLSARCPLADVPSSACEAPPPRHLTTETWPTHNKHNFLFCASTLLHSQHRFNARGEADERLDFWTF
jgi:hypothetical protein